jgi:hypothetical protein
MTREEYNRLFHKHELNLVAFKPLNDCDEEVLRLVNAAIEAEREACAKVCEERQEVFEKYYTKGLAAMCAEAIRARGNT